MKPINKRFLRKQWNIYKAPIIFFIYVVSLGISIYYMYNYKLILSIIWLLPAAITATLIYKERIK